MASTQTRPAAGASAGGALDARSLSAYIAFFLSGASSLIFQTIWTRMLHHVFGATSVAISTVLTVFMAGLGLGTWLAGKYAHRIKHPIITYAIAEVGVGLFGLLIPLLVRPDGWLSTVNAFLRAELGAESGMFMVARFLCVAPILIIPTTLMGSTLPLLTRHFVSATHNAREAGARVGVLYAINTFGAATGPLLSAFVLLPTVGLAVTNMVACSMNLTLAALIWITKGPLLRGSWKRGEKLRFWPGKTDLDAPPLDASPDAPPPVTDAVEGESFTDLDPKKAKVGAYRDPATRDLEDAAPGKRKTRGKRKRAERASDRASGRPSSASLGALDELPIPELARKFAFLCFAASGAAALCYEVVWARALAMTIGSSIYSFALILVTFLVGIAGGSAAMSSFLGKQSKPYLGIGITSIGLVVLANVPWALDIVDPADTSRRMPGSATSYVVLTLLYSAPIVLALIFVAIRLSRERLERAVFRDSVDVWRPLLAVLMAAVPVGAAVINTLKFPGYLPQIILSVVALIAVFLVLSSLLSRTPVLLVALIQLFIAAATVVSYVWQDEIPRAFAQLLVSIPTDQLPNHVLTVRFFMGLTIALCTLPATLGMGAMFPLVVRVWTSGGKGIARDVAVVYTGNTVGSIIGSWLPGFILFALVGAEETLYLGVGLNMALALVMLIVGAADPSEDQTWWTWRRLAAITLPLLGALALAPTLLPKALDDWRWWLRIVAVLGFLSLAAVEYLWLRACSSRDAHGLDAARAGAATLIPLVLLVALAVFMVEPAENAEWAVKAIFFALRLFVVQIGVTAAWANWREWVARSGSTRALVGGA